MKKKLRCFETEENIAVIDESVNRFIDGELEYMTMSEGGRLPPPPQAGAGGVSLPCLYMNNVIGNESKPERKTVELSEKWAKIQGVSKASRLRVTGKLDGWERKAAQALFLNAGELLQRGVERCAFVTITTPQNMSYWSKEGWETARKRFRSWITHCGGLPYVFGSGRDWCRVIEPQRRGAIHWHLLVDCGVDIRSGVDFEAFAARDYRSAGPALRGMWAKMRESCKRYKLGRSEIAPIKSDRWEAAARYVGKYISKGVRVEAWERACEEKARPVHSRRVGFSSGWKVANGNFAWVEDGEDWRKAVAYFAETLGITEYSQLSELLGKKWAYHNRKFIIEDYNTLRDNDLVPF